MTDATATPAPESKAQTHTQTKAGVSAAFADMMHAILGNPLSLSPVKRPSGAYDLPSLATWKGSKECPLDENWGKLKVETVEEVGTC